MAIAAQKLEQALLRTEAQLGARRRSPSNQPMGCESATPKDAAGPFGEEEECRVRPVPGLIVRMPGYFSHRTVPLGTKQRRVCVAFEIYPAE